MSFFGLMQPIERSERPARGKRWRVGLLAAALVAVGMSSSVSSVFAKLDEGQLAILGLDPKFKGSGTDELEKAFNSLKEGNGDRALEHLQSAVKGNSSLPTARVLLARMLFATNQQQLIPTAKQLLEQALVDDPNSFDAHLLLGNLAVTEGRLSDAELQFDKAMALAANVYIAKDDPTFNRIKRQVYAGETMIAEARQKWESAISAASLWLEASSDDKPQAAMAEQHLGRANFSKDPPDLAAARDHFTQAFKLDPKVEYPLISLGLLAAQSGDGDAKAYMDEALANVDSGIVSDKKTIAAIHQAISQWLLANNESVKAAEQAEKAIKADPDSDALKRLMGILALYQKDYAGAEKLFGEMYNANAGDFFASNNLALALIEAEPVDDTEKAKADAKAKHDRAVGLAEVNVRAFPRSADAIATLGWIYFKQNRLDEAQQALSSAIQGTNGQATPSTAYYLANVFTKRNRLDDAVKVLQQALQFQGPFPYRKEAELMLKRYRPDIDLNEFKPKPAEKADKSDKDKTSATKASDNSKKSEPAKKSPPK